MEAGCIPPLRSHFSIAVASLFEVTRSPSPGAFLLVLLVGLDCRGVQELQHVGAGEGVHLARVVLVIAVAAHDLACDDRIGQNVFNSRNNVHILKYGKSGINSRNLPSGASHAMNGSIILSHSLHVKHFL